MFQNCTLAKKYSCYEVAELARKFLALAFILTHSDGEEGMKSAACEVFPPHFSQVDASVFHSQCFLPVGAAFKHQHKPVRAVSVADS